MKIEMMIMIRNGLCVVMNIYDNINGDKVIIVGNYKSNGESVMRLSE